MKKILKIIFILQLLCFSLFAKYNKIIAICPGALRFIVYMNLENKLCGVENIEFKLKTGLIRPYSIKIKKIIKNLPVIAEGGPGVLPYFERINLIRPDIIIAVGYTKAQVDLIEKKTNTKVVLLNYGTLGSLNNEFLVSLLKLGKIFNKENRAEKLVKFINNMIIDLKQRTKYVKNNKKVYIGGIAYKGLHDLTSTDTDFYPANLINVINVANYSKLKGHIFVNWEDLYIWDPDIIFIDKTSLPIIEANFQKYKERYLTLKAYKNKNVYLIFPLW